MENQDTILYECWSLGDDHPLDGCPKNTFSIKDGYLDIQIRDQYVDGTALVKLSGKFFLAEITGIVWGTTDLVSVKLQPATPESLRDHLILITKAMDARDLSELFRIRMLTEALDCLVIALFRETRIP